jgi:hypothetical protein
MTYPFIVIRRLKISHKSPGSYAFILEDGTATTRIALDIGFYFRTC